MTAIEKFLRDRLGQADAPPELDADALWSDIVGSLPPNDDAPAVMKSGRWTLITGIILLLLVFLGVFLFWRPAPEAATLVLDEPVVETTTANEEPSTAVSDVSNEATDDIVETTSTDLSPNKFDVLQEASNTHIITAKKAISSGKSPLAESASKKINISDAIISGKMTSPVVTNTADRPPPPKPANFAVTPTSPASRAPAPVSENEISISKAGGIITDTETGRFAVAPTSPASRAPVPVSKNETSSTKVEVAITNTATNNEHPAALAVAAKAIPALSLPDFNVAPPALPTTTTSPTFFRRHQQNRLQLTVAIGTNLLSRTYSDGTEALTDQLNKAVGPALGSNIGVYLDYRLGERWSVGSGISYYRTLNTFAHTSLRDTMVEHPSEFNSGPITAVAKRSVTHNHRMSYLSIPLTLTHQRTFGDFKLGLSAGVGLNFRQSVTGKTLNTAGETISYDSASGEADVPDFFLSYHLRPQIGWRPGGEGKLSLVLQSDLTYLRFGRSTLSGAKQSSLITGLSIGFRYGL